MKLSNSKITFLGDRCAWDLTGKIASVASQPEWKFVALTYAADLAKTGAWIGPSYVLGVSMLAVSALRFHEYFLIEQFALEKGVPLKNQCIETKPQQTTAQPNFAHANLAQKLSVGYAALSGMNATMWAGPILRDTVTLAQSGDALPLVSSITACSMLMTRLVGGWNRWSKVRDGRYRITDKGPPPKKKKQEKPQQGPSAKQPALATMRQSLSPLLSKQFG